jgi:hypothetical protein
MIDTIKTIETSQEIPFFRGTIITREYAGDFSEEEYHRILQGPSSHRTPDTYTRDGTPVYIWSDYERRWTKRQLDNLCQNKMETHNVACNAGRTNVLNYLGNTVDQGVTVVGNQVLIATNFSTAEANTTYTEAGLIGGSTAVVTPGGAGTLFAHAAYSYTKTSSVSLTNDYYLSLA